jgi:hypothetical protein
MQTTTTTKHPELSYDAAKLTQRYIIIVIFMTTVLNIDKI